MLYGIGIIYSSYSCVLYVFAMLISWIEFFVRARRGFISGD